MIDQSNFKHLRFLVAGYGLPGEFGLMTLFSLGVPLTQIALLTHAADSRNMGLRSLAELRGITMIDSDANAPETIEWVEKFKPDLLISLHYRMLIPKKMLSLLPLGGVNLHPSLLPNYRGTNSVAWAIINGEKETGFTYHRMDHKFDTGNLLLQEVIPIYEADTAFSLFHRQIIRAIRRLEIVIQKIIACEDGVTQSEGGSYFKRVLPYSGIIDPFWNISTIDRFIRAMHFPPLPPAMLKIDGCSHPIRSIDEYRRVALENRIPVSNKI